MSTSNILKWRASGYGPVQKVTIGTLGVGVGANHFTADGKNFVSEFVVNSVFPAIVGGTNLSVGFLMWTFPAGVHMLKVARIALGLTQSEGNVNADTPDLGLGDTVGSGANTNLSSVAASENILLGQTSNNCTGTVEDKTIIVPTAGHLVNESAGTKTVYINVADGWAASGDAALGISGSVWLEWTRLSGV